MRAVGIVGDQVVKHVLRELRIVPVPLAFALTGYPYLTDPVAADFDPAAWVDDPHLDPVQRLTATAQLQLLVGGCGGGRHDDRSRVQRSSVDLDGSLSRVADRQRILGEPIGHDVSRRTQPVRRESLEKGSVSAGPDWLSRVHEDLNRA